ncbi:hypothetical protein ACTWQB_10255 [Piscibacillus sp. B03]|uniref:hypothetical protein n=1 Tax=Piscibacillus sp. B03 TaxID=3457430 RepID=UPI003FCEDCE9
MKNKIYFLVGLAMIIVILIVIFNLTKPDENDFVQWFEDHYNISCEDEKCHIIILESTGEKYVSGDFYYSPSSGFLGMAMQTKRQYIKFDSGGSEYFSIEVRGLLGQFEVLELKKNHIEIQEIR